MPKNNTLPQNIDSHNPGAGLQHNSSSPTSKSTKQPTYYGLNNNKLSKTQPDSNVTKNNTTADVMNGYFKSYNQELQNLLQPGHTTPHKPIENGIDTSSSKDLVNGSSKSKPPQYPNTSTQTPLLKNENEVSPTSVPASWSSYKSKYLTPSSSSSAVDPSTPLQSKQNGTSIRPPFTPNAEIPASISQASNSKERQLALLLAAKESSLQRMKEELDAKNQQMDLIQQQWMVLQEKLKQAQTPHVDSTAVMQLQQKVLELENDNSQLKSHITQQQASYSLVNLENTKYKTQLKEQDNSIKVLRERVQAMKSQLEGFEKSHSLAAKKEASMQQTISQQQQQVESLSKENDSVRDLLEKQKKKFKVLVENQQNIKEQTEDLEKMKSELENMRKADNYKNNTIKTLKEALQAKDDQLRTLDKDLKEKANVALENAQLVANVELLRQEIEKRDIALNQLSAGLPVYQAEIQENHRMHSEFQKDMEKKSEYIKSLKQQLQELLELHNQQQATISTQNNALKGLQRTLVEKDEAIKQLSRAMEGIQSKNPMQQFSGHVKELEATITSQKAEMIRLQNAVSEKDNKLRDQDKIIQQLSKQAVPIVKDDSKRTEELEAQVQRQYEDIELLVKEVEEKEQIIAKLETQSRQLPANSDQHQHLKKQLAEVETRYQKLMKENKELQSKAEGSKESSITATKLSAEAVACLAELSVLKKIIVENIEGKEPNFSLIVGTKEPDYAETEETHKSRTPMEVVVAIRNEVADLQNVITAYYADRLASNQCVIQ